MCLQEHMHIDTYPGNQKMVWESCLRKALSSETGSFLALTNWTRLAGDLAPELRLPPITGLQIYEALPRIFRWFLGAGLRSRGNLCPLSIATAP